MAIFHSIQSGIAPCALAVAALVTGCTAPAASTVGSSSAGTSSAQSSSAVGTEELAPQTMLAQVQALSEEVRTLRDQVEVLEIELDDTKQRQMDLYDDLDARLRKFERTGSGSNLGTEQTDGVESSSDETTPSGESDAVSAEGEGTAVATLPDSVPDVDPEVIREVYDTGFRALKQGKYEDAISTFTALVDNYPQSELVDDALYWIAEANYVTKKHDVALQGFEQIIRDYPDNRRAAEAMLKIAIIYADQENYEQAENYLLEVMERYPASRSAFNANRRLNKLKRDGNL